MASTFPYPNPIISWKGKTFAQVSTFIQQNQNGNHAVPSYMLANPVTQYRRELAVPNITQCSQRTNVKIDELDRPNGYLVYPEGTQVNGINGTLDPVLPNNQSVLGNVCNVCNDPASGNCQTSSTLNQNVCFTDENKARRRCRSAGMIQNKYKIHNNNDPSYFTDTKQYLTSRNRMFSQNQYNYIRQGTSTAKPGTPLTEKNVYSAQGLSHCPLYTINESNNTLSYVWLDGTVNPVQIPSGEYNVDSFQAAFQQTMHANGHYYLRTSDQTIYYLMQFGYDTTVGRINLELLPPSTYASLTPGGTWIPSGTNTPQIILNNAPLTMTGLGFYVGTYPATSSASVYTFVAPNRGNLLPNYVVTQYKPSNSRFATQGGVTSSAYVARLKYDTVNTAAANTGPTNNYGQEVANELAYGVPFVGYTTKDKVGFPNISAPVIRPNGELRSCKKFIYR